MLFATLGTLGSCATLPGTLELTLLTTASWLPRRVVPLQARSVGRIAVVIPAHNETLLIARAVKSVRACPSHSGGFDVIVVADNCTDDTASRAETAGARVLVRNNPHERGKGFALDFAFQTLLAEHDGDAPRYDAFLVVDADTEVAPNFVTACAAVFSEGADGVQTPYLVRNPTATEETQFTQVAMYAFNIVRPKGRERLGLSVGILGNGFGLSRATLHAVPYHARSVVEDLEYHLMLVQQGLRIRFVEDTKVVADMPITDAANTTQRQRWEGGRMKLVREVLPGLLPRILRGERSLIEPALELSLLPLSNHVAALLATLCIPFFPTQLYALMGLGVTGVHVLSALKQGQADANDWSVLKGVPGYIGRKLVKLPGVWSASKTSEWIRTARS